MATFVREYGLFPPTTERQTVEDQMVRAHRYYNTLIEVECAYRKRHREAAGAAYGPTWTAANDQIHDFKDQVKEATQLLTDMKDAQAPPATTAAQRQTIKALKAALQAARTDEKAIRSGNPAATAQLAAARKVLFEERNEAARAARAASGLIWGTYQMVEEAWKRACRDVVIWRLPRFKRMGDRLSMAVHLQNNAVAPVADVHNGTSQWAQIDPVPPEAWDPQTPRGQRRRLRQTTLRLRVGTAAKRRPIWAEWRMILHRPLPPNSEVVWVKVFRERHATRFRWTAHVTVTAPDPAPAPVGKAVGLDLGWLSTRRGDLRAAFWHDTTGAGDELALPQSIRDRLGKADDIRAIRDRDMNRMRDAILPVLKATPDLLPEVHKLVQRMPKWRSPKRFVGLLRHWAQALPATVVSLLEAWQRRDAHLWQYETGMRDGALGHRREILRVFAAKLVADYGTIMLEEFNLHEAARRLPGEATEHEPDWRKGVRHLAARQRVEVAPGEARTAICNAARAAGVRVIFVDRAGTTETCHDCGLAETWPDPLARRHTCSGCGRQWDRDENAAKNILARGLVILRGGHAPAPETPASSAAPRHTRGALAARKAPKLLDGASSP